MNRAVYIISGLILLGVLIALIWAAQTHFETVRSLPDVLARDIAPLLENRRIRDIDLGALEDHIEQLRERYPYLREIVIRKQDLDGQEHTVYPFYYDLENPEFRLDGNIDYYQRGIRSEAGLPSSTLYIRMDERRGRLFLAAIAGSIVALLVVAGLGFYTLRSQEEEVRKTSVLLEEKQRELIRLERLALVGQITANLLHDLKKPVLNIRADAGNIPDADLRQSIHEETDLFLNLLRELQLESFLRQDREHAEFIDVGEVLMRSLRLVRYAQKNVEVKFDLPESLPFLFGQRHHLVQIFSNILLNAFQALEGEGEILVSAQLVEQENETWLEIAFTDNGPGMPYEVLTHVFEPFYSTRSSNESTGLGLYISKSLVEQMGGAILAQSIPKHGTTFTLRFPLSEEERIDQ